MELKTKLLLGMLNKVSGLLANKGLYIMFIQRASDLTDSAPPKKSDRERSVPLNVNHKDD